VKFKSELQTDVGCPNTWNVTSGTGRQIVGAKSWDQGRHKER